MLEKQINRIKNIIFLKLVCFGLIFIILCYFLPFLAKEKEASAHSLANAQLLLNNLQSKVYHLANDKESVIQAEGFYRDLLKEQTNSACLMRLKILNSIKAFGSDYKLEPKFEVRVSTPVQDNKLTQADQWVVVRTNDVTVNFAHKDLESFIEAAEIIYDLLPEYRSVESLEITHSNIVNFESLDKVSKGEQPKLVQGQLDYKISTIKVDKSKIYKIEDKLLK
ncbi:MAG: hypothetical protein K0Q51_357 [Rickettsiaceae bacterium]|nr:hypothetical protein [Rickettsiaceae bacterium]